MSRPFFIGIIFGSLTGIIDIIPMQLNNLPFQAILSAFSMWVVVGIFISTSSWKLNPILKGISISLMVLLPCSFLIGWKEPMGLFPIVGMTVFLGAGLGWVISRV